MGFYPLKSESRLRCYLVGNQSAYDELLQTVRSHEAQMTEFPSVNWFSTLGTEKESSWAGWGWQDQCYIPEMLTQLQYTELTEGRKSGRQIRRQLGDVIVKWCQQKWRTLCVRTTVPVEQLQMARLKEGGIKNVWGSVCLKHCWKRRKFGPWIQGLTLWRYYFEPHNEISKWCSMERYGDGSLTTQLGPLSIAYTFDKNMNEKFSE